MQPIVVTSHGDSVENAVDEAIDKMKTSLDTVIGRLQNYLHQHKMFSSNLSVKTNSRMSVTTKKR